MDQLIYFQGATGFASGLEVGSREVQSQLVLESQAGRWRLSVQSGQGGLNLRAKQQLVQSNDQPVKGTHFAYRQ